MVYDEGHRCSPGTAPSHRRTPVPPALRSYSAATLDGISFIVARCCWEARPERDVQTPGGAAPLRLSRTLPSGRGVGNPGFPVAQPRLGAAGASTGRGAVRQAHRKWGTPVSPWPNRGWERLAPLQAGVRFDRLTASGETRCPRMVTAGRGLGKPGFPSSPPLVGAADIPPAGVRFDRLTASGETRCPRMVTAGKGMGKPGVPGWSPQAGGWGKTRCPHIPTAGGSGWRPHQPGCGSTGSPQVGKAGVPGWSPQGRGWGNPVSPGPNRGWERLAPHRQGCGSTGSPQVGKPGVPGWSPQAGGWGNPVSPVPHRWWERLAPHRQGCGSTGSPQVGKPGCPVCSPQRNSGEWGNRWWSRPSRPHQ